jgi:hypothetical protein
MRVFDLDLDEAAIRADERRATATLAVAAVLRGQQPPSDTPLQRTAGRLAETELRRWQIQQMRARLEPTRGQRH